MTATANEGRTTVQKLKRKGSSKGMKAHEPKTPQAPRPGTEIEHGGPAARTDAKEQQAHKQVLQLADPAKVPANAITLTNEVRDKAHEIARKFHEANKSYESLKDKVAKAKSALANYLFDIAKLAAESVGDRAELRLVAYDRLCADVEAWELNRYRKEKGDPNAEVAIKDLLGSSWRTYKSQMRQNVRAGYDPRDFKTAQEFRTYGAAKPTRGARQGKGEATLPSANAPAGSIVLDAPAMPDRLVKVLTNLITACGKVHKDDEARVSDMVMETMRRIGEINAKRKEKAETKKDEAATA